ncbi:unnamed protein product [Closterium sp. Yama58-4]|nr:unnamed protein product [Closterium sp. Yama58-4]
MPPVRSVKSVRSVRSVRSVSIRSIHWAGLAWEADEKVLEDAFSPFGTVEEAKVIRDRFTGRSRGFGFVSFANDEEAASALEGVNGKELSGRTVPEMSVTDLHRLLLAQQAAGGGEGLGTNGEADGGGAGLNVGRGQVGGGEVGGGEVGGGRCSGRGGRRVVVVDTRTEEEAAVSMIPGGTLKQSDFERQMGRFSDHQVVCYCTIGYRSGNYARMLRSHHSMHASNLRGSILAWTHHGLPLTSLYHPETGSGPLPLPHHANTSANTSIDTSTSNEATAQRQAITDQEASREGATGSGAASVLPVLPLGATTRVHVYSPKYELHADGYHPVHFGSGVPWVSVIWSDISMRVPKWLHAPSDRPASTCHSANQHPAFPLDRLPDDVLSLVLQHLSRNSLAHAFVCKRWFRLTCLARVYLKVSRAVQSAQLLSAVDTFPTLSQLDIAENTVPHATDELLRGISARCPNLTRLLIGYQFRARFSPAGLSALFRGCARLQQLRLFSLSGISALPASLTLLSQLEVLELGDDPAWRGLDTFANLIESDVSLDSLSCMRKLVVSSRCFESLPWSIGELTRLEHLEIHSEVLSSLPGSFGQLGSLAVLKLEAKCLEELPESLGRLKNLQRMWLTNCESLSKLPDSFGQLSSLSFLSIHLCDRLRSLPESFSFLPALETLKLHELPSLRTLPELFGHLPKLRVLDMSTCGVVRLPLSLYLLARLERLSVAAFPDLPHVPPLTAQLLVPPPRPPHQSLPPGASSASPASPSHSNASASVAGGGIPGISVSVPLILEMTDHTGILALPEDLGCLPKLELLRLVRLDNFTVLPDSLGQLKSLRKLMLSQLPNLEYLPASLPQLPSLELLVIHQCANLASLPRGTISGLRNLSKVALIECTSLCSLDSEEGKASRGGTDTLRHVLVFDCGMKSLPPSLLHVESLQTVHFRNGGWFGFPVFSLPEVYGFSRTFPSITFLDIAENALMPPVDSPILQDDLVRRISDTCPHLKSFALAHQSRAEGRVSAQGLSVLFRGCPRLESLRLLSLSAIPALPRDVSRLTNLSALELGDSGAWCWGEGGKLALAEGEGGVEGGMGGCMGAEEGRQAEWENPRLAREGSRSSLGFISARIRRQRDSSLTSLTTCASHLQCLSALTHLRVNSWCLQALPASLGALKMLSHLEITSEKVSVLPEEICDLPLLQVLCLRLRKLSQLPERMGSLASLQQLRLRDCTCLVSLPDSFRQLRIKLLELHNCASLTALPDNFGSLSQLQTLRMIWVYHLSNLPDSFGQLSNLRFLDLEQCTALRDLPGPVDSPCQGQTWLPALESLRLVGLRHLDSLPPLGQLKKLRRLTVSLLCKLEELPPSLSRLSNLQTLVIHGCSQIKSLPHNIPSALSSLSSLAILSCCSIQDLDLLSCCYGALEACSVGGVEGRVTSAAVKCDGIRCGNVEGDSPREAERKLHMQTGTLADGSSSCCTSVQPRRG